MQEVTVQSIYGIRSNIIDDTSPPIDGKININGKQNYA